MQSLVANAQKNDSGELQKQYIIIIRILERI